MRRGPSDNYGCRWQDKRTLDRIFSARAKGTKGSVRYMEKEQPREVRKRKAAGNGTGYLFLHNAASAPNSSGLEIQELPCHACHLSSDLLAAPPNDGGCQGML